MGYTPDIYADSKELKAVLDKIEHEAWVKHDPISNRLLDELESSISFRDVELIVIRTDTTQENRNIRQKLDDYEIYYVLEG